MAITSSVIDRAGTRNDGRHLGVAHQGADPEVTVHPLDRVEAGHQRGVGERPRRGDVGADAHAVDHADARPDGGAAPEEEGVVARASPHRVIRPVPARQGDSLCAAASR